MTLRINTARKRQPNKLVTGTGQLFRLLKTTFGDSFTNTTVCDEEG
jgi:hypothetical protein